MRRLFKPDKRHFAKINQLIAELTKDGYTIFTIENIKTGDIEVYTDNENNIGFAACENSTDNIIWL